MKFGLALPQYEFSLGTSKGLDWQSVRDWAVKAEQLGFSSVWLSDHLFLDLARYGGSDYEYEALEGFTCAAAILSSTKTVRVGILVVCNDLRPPALVAKMAATLAILSGGRFEVGLGAGWYEPEFREAGVEFHPAGVRVSRMEEALQVVKGMLSHERFSFEGEHYQVKDAVNLPLPPPSERPPVFVGGKGDRVSRIAGTHADGFNTVWGWTPEGYAGRVELVDRAARKAGRDPKTVAKSVGLYTLNGRDEQALKERWQAYVSASPIGDGGLEPDKWGEDKLWGTPEQIVKRVNEFKAMGVQEVILGFGMLPFQIADEAAVDEFVQEVFPLFQ